MQSFIVKNVMCLSFFFIFFAFFFFFFLFPTEDKVPVLQTDDHYKYAVLNWKKTSSLEVNANTWWEIFQDPILSQLMQQLNQENLSLKQAEARYQQANALLEQQRANRLPCL